MVTKEETAVIVAPKDNLPDRLGPDSTIRACSTDREGNSSIVPEKPSEDGYNWRKYGQKNVKGNEYIRSYYKCSHPNCQVKKQVERSHEGRITDITYLGKHDHIKPHSDPHVAVPSLLSVKVQIPNHPPVAADEDIPADVPAATTDHVKKMDVCELAIVKTTATVTPVVLTPSSLATDSTALVPLTPSSLATDITTPVPLTPSSLGRDDHGENLTLKKRKKGIDGTDSATEKSNQESRVIVHTVSEVDIVNDGYRWRKYGQKMVKGNPNPRSYYRCSTTGCPVKKHVERASHDPKVVITTYEGQHDHSMPPVRTIVPQAAGASAGGTESNEVSKSKSEESDPEKSDSVDPTTASKDENNFMIVVRTDPISRSTDQEASLAEKTEPITHIAQEEKVPSVEHDMVPETVSAEAKPSVELDMMPETVSAEAKPSMEFGKKPEIVSDEAQPSSEFDKKPKIVSAEAKSSVEYDKKPEIVLTNATLSAELDKKPEIATTEGKRPDAIVEKSNGLQRPNADAVNC